MRESRWLWWLAVLCFAVGVSVSAVEAATGATEAGGGSAFTFAQVALLVAIGAAWGDMRTNRQRDREDFQRFQGDVVKRLEHLEEKVHHE